MSLISKELSDNIKAKQYSEGHFVATRIISEIKNGSFSSIQELEKHLDDLMLSINDTRPYFIKLQDEKDNCDHEYDAGMYYDMRMMMGDYIRKFEHTCNKCGHVETEHGELGDLESPFPKGFESCGRGYYNNNI